MGEVELLLKKAEEHLREALRQEGRGNFAQAKSYYLQAARELFQAASGSQGRMKEIRVINAERLLEKAKSLRMERVGVEEGEISSALGLVLEKKPQVTFDDVAGLEDVKEAIKDKIIYPFLYPDKAQKYGIKSGGGVLLYGPPGTGKTHIAKAIANEVEAVFFSIKPSEIMSKWVGESEKKVAELFRTARRQTRAVIFIDEVEALLPKRKDSSSTVMQRVVPQLLAEMDGIESSNENILFIGATNEPWSLDVAALRPGRFDEKFYIPPPDFEARRRIFELNLKGKPLSQDIDLDELARLTEGYSGADIAHICLKASLIPFREAILEGRERAINREDLLEAIRAIKPSIDQKMVERHRRFGAVGERGGHEDS